MPKTSKHKQQLRRAKRRATIAENNESLRRQVAQLQQYLQFVSGQAFESRALLFTILFGAPGLEIGKEQLEFVKSRLTDLELKVVTHATDMGLLVLSVESVVKEASGSGLTVTKIAEDAPVDGSGAEDAGADAFRGPDTEDR